MSPQRLFSYVRQFYEDRHPNNPSVATDASCWKPLVDKKFLGRVWQWLVRSPDIRIGDQDEYDGWSLQDVEAGFPESAIDLDEVGPIDRLGGLGESKTAPRLFASQNLVYHALVGHGPDRSRVFDMEYQLLCAIAATRYDGILQGELGRVTGQDKRSVPKRNDLLQEKGYIVKRLAWMGGHKTSRLYLRRFAQQPASGSVHHKVFCIKDLAEQVVATIQASTCPITQDQLAMDMSMTDPARAKLLGLLLRALVRSGCLKKLRAAFGAAARADDLKICLQVVRPLQDSDCQHSDDSLDFSASVENVLAVSSIDLDTDDPEATDNIEDEDEDLHSASSKAFVAHSRPQWNPSRLMTNQLFDHASQDGPQGMTNKSARQDITGYFVRRPVESLLVRLSHSALRSQPYGTERVSIVRTQENVGSSKIYIHRTFDFYHDSVTAGLSDWTDLPGGAEIVERLRATRGLLTWNRDRFGLIDRVRPKLQAHNGQASFEDVIRGSKIQNCAIRNGELGIIRRKDGTFEIAPIVDSNDRGRNRSPGHATPTAKSQPNKGTSKCGNTATGGRPKKIATRDKNIKAVRPWTPGLEHYWRHMFLTAKIQEDPTYPPNLDAPGLMTEQAGLDMFTRRPETFEQIVLEALQQNLPVPSRVADISQQWVEKMKEILCRRHPGLYTAPTGMLIASKGRFERIRKSCKVVIKSTRLNEVDLREDKLVCPIFNISSSISHSHRLPNPYFWYRGPTPEWLMLLEKPFEEDPVVAARIAGRARQQASKQGKVDVELTPLEGPVQSFMASVLHEAFSAASAMSPPLGTPPALDQPGAPPSLQNEGRHTQRQPLVKASFEPHTYPDPESSDPQKEQVQLRQAISIPRSSQVVPSDSAIRSTGADEILEPATDLQTAQVRAQESCELEASDLLGGSQGFVRTRKQDLVRRTTDKQAALWGISLHTTMSDEDLEAHDEPILDPALRSAGPGLETLVYDAELQKDNSAKPTNDNAPVFLRGRDATREYKKYILELVNLVGGVMPYSPPTLKRAMKAKCMERNVDPEPNIKLIKSQINLLCNAGKLKDVKIAFQDRSGRTHYKWIIALPDIAITDPRFIQLQSKIVDTPPDEEYVQPEMEIEASRLPRSIIFRTPPCSDDEQSRKKPSVPRASLVRAVKAREVSQQKYDAVVGRSLLVPPKPTTANTGFLSLRTPNLNRLSTVPSTGHGYRFQEAPPRLTFVTDANAANSSTAHPTPVAMRTSGAGLAGKGSLKWLPKRIPLPKTLKGIMVFGRPLTEIEVNAQTDPTYFRFEHQINFVSAWERQNFEHLEQRVRDQWFFINHSVDEKTHMSTVQPGEFEYRLVKFNANNEDGFDTAMPPAESWPPFIAVTPDRVRRRDDQRNDKRKRSSVDVDEVNSRDSDFEADLDRPRRKKNKRVIVEQQKKRSMEEMYDEAEDEEEEAASTRTGRGRTGARLQKEARGVGTRRVADTVILQIITAVTVVSVLSGGLDKYANWKYIGRLITHEPESIVRQRWKVIRANYTQEIDAVTSNFQNSYLDALADGVVPTVNFDDLDSTDWEGIFEWAMKNIDHSKVDNPILDLPEERDEILQLNHVEVSEAKPLRELFTMGLHFSHPTREAAFCSVMHGITHNHNMGIENRDFAPRFPLEEAEHDEELARARSWVLAAILTPSSTYKAQHTRQKLLKLGSTPQRCDELIEKATRILKSERLIVDKDSAGVVQLSDGRVLSGTDNYKLGIRYLEIFESKRMITPTMLKRAVKFKLEELDTKFARGEVFTITKENEELANGDMVAIMNLLAVDQMNILPSHDVPARRYGIDSENQGYKTRSMDKNILAFSMELHPTPLYQFGDTTLQQRLATPIPCGNVMHDQNGTGPIPPWFDINLTFHPALWEMYLAAIIGLISLRPGVSSTEVMRVLGSVLTLRDVEMVIAWLMEVGYVRKTCTGWETTEWWWCAIGAGAEGGVIWNT